VTGPTTRLDSEAERTPGGGRRRVLGPAARARRAGR